MSFTCAVAVGDRAARVRGAEVDPDDRVGGELLHRAASVLRGGPRWSSRRVALAGVRAGARSARRWKGARIGAPLGRDLEVARMDARRWLSTVGSGVKGAFDENRSILSFEEYLQTFVEAPRQHARSSAQYLRDVLDHFGSEERETPVGQGPPLEALRPAVRAGGPRAARRGAGGGPGGALPRARHVRPVRPGDEAHPAPRPERLGEVVDRRRARARDGGVLARARGRALPVPLGLPERAAG